MKKKLLIALCLPLVTILIIGAAQMIPGSVGYPPAGLNGQIQYYTNGVLGASSDIVATNRGIKLVGPLWWAGSNVITNETGNMDIYARYNLTLHSMNNGNYTWGISWNNGSFSSPGVVLGQALADNSGFGTLTPQSTLQSGGSFALPTITKTTNYTLTVSDHTVLAAVDGLTLTLPLATNIAGRIYILGTFSPANTLTITNSNGINLVGPALSYSLTASNQVVHVQSDGTNWNVITPNTSPVGSNGYYQFNNNGSFSGSSPLLTSGGNVYVNGGAHFAISYSNPGDNSFDFYAADAQSWINTAGSLPLRIIKGVRLDGSFSAPTITKTTNYTLTVSDHTVLAAADNLTLTFPSTTNIAGRIYRVKLITPAVSLTLTNSNGIQLIDGALSHSMTTSNTCAAFQTDGTNWWKISN